MANQRVLKRVMSCPSRLLMCENIDLSYGTVVEVNTHHCCLIIVYAVLAEMEEFPQKVGECWYKATRCRGNMASGMSMHLELT